MITIKSENEIELIKKAGEIVSKTHEYLKQYLCPGMMTSEINKLAEDFIEKMGGIPTCRGYGGFPAGLCISINDEVVHGIPGDRKLRNGDIVTIDMVVSYKGYQADSAWTYAVGDISVKKQYLMEHTEKALYEGIKMAKPGNRIGDISNAVEVYAKKHNLGVVKELVGHGIGIEMHEDPDVPNYGIKGTGPILKEGMTICIEPMLTLGSPDICQLDDGWTIITEDGLPAAHYEHTIVITKDGNEIITKRLG